MKKIQENLAKILILFTLLVPLVPVFALDQVECGPGDLYNRDTGLPCPDYTGGEPEGTGGTENGDNGGTSTPVSYTKSDLFVATGEATNITLTSATLNGSGGDKLANPTLPVTAYFRYSPVPIQPVFCNDVYSANMISTGDLNLGISSSASFYQNIYDLTPDTTYYYCAIVSNKEKIAYGGPSIVKQFHTNCYDTTIKTADATNVRSASATLKGSYCSTKNVKTSFQYRKSWKGQLTAPNWTKVGETSYLIGNKSNLYGNFNFNLSSLAPNTIYEFRAMAENSGKFFEGAVLNFMTFPALGGGSGSSGGSGNTGGGTGGGGVNTGGGTGGVNTGGGAGGVNTGGVGSGANTGGVGSGTNTGGPGSGTNTGGVGSGANSGTWGSGANTNNGTWGSGVGSGTWTATKGTGGTGTATWTGKNGICTWTSATGSGTATGCPEGTGIWNNLVLGSIATPPSDAIVRYHEGIEHVFVRQIMRNTEITRRYGYQAGTDLQTFAWNLSDIFAIMFGYINAERREIRVSLPDIAAYQLVMSGDKLIVYEYYGDKIVDIRDVTAVFKSASAYEYYFKK